MRRNIVVLSFVVGVCTPGCAFGPHTLEKTHGRYNDAYRTVDSEELLLNIVRLRYGDIPAEVEVSSIAAQYELSAETAAVPFFQAQADSAMFRSFPSVLPSAGLTGASRPTISLTPIHSGETVIRYLRPITLDGVVFFADTSWPISSIFRLWLDGMNGVPNAPSASGPARSFPPAFAEFQRACELLQGLQDRGELAFRKIEEDVPGDPIPADRITGEALVEARKAGLEYRLTPDGKAWQLVRKASRLYLNISPRALGTPEYEELVRLLNLRNGLTRFEVTQSTVGFLERQPGAAPSDKLVLVPRSLIQVLFYISNGVEVPGADLGCAARATLEPDGRVFDWQQVVHNLFTVKVACGKKPPANALVAVRYRGYWFYIDETDHATKGTFVLLRPARHLDLGATNGERRGNAPILTLPVGR